MLAQHWGSPRAGSLEGKGLLQAAKLGARDPPGEQALPLGSRSVVTESSHGQAAGRPPSWAKDTSLGSADQVLVGQILFLLNKAHRCLHGDSSLTPRQRTPENDPAKSP